MEKRQRYWAFFLTGQAVFILLAVISYFPDIDILQRITPIIGIGIQFWAFEYLDRLRKEQGSWRPVILGFLIFGLILAAGLFATIHWNLY